MHFTRIEVPEVGRHFHVFLDESCATHGLSATEADEFVALCQAAGVSDRHMFELVTGLWEFIDPMQIANSCIAPGLSFSAPLLFYEYGLVAELHRLPKPITHFHEHAEEEWRAIQLVYGLKLSKK